MFFRCRSLTSLDVSNFDTSNVTNMAHTFRECKLLTSLDVSNFNTANVTNMISMFDGCNLLVSLDLSNFDTSKVTNTGYMFSYCRALTNLNFGTLTSNYTTITDSTKMFEWDESLNTLVINGGSVLPLTSSDAIKFLKDDCQIKVPANLVDSYKIATN